MRQQFTEEYDKIRVSDECCRKIKEEPLRKWQEENGKPYVMIGLMRTEGGRRVNSQCLVFKGKRLNAFQPLVSVSKEWEEWFINEYNIKLCDLYYPPYNFVRTGCKGCPFAKDLQRELDVLERFFPAERKQCEIIWRPVYEEYRRLGYRLKPFGKNEDKKIETEIEGQMNIFDFIEKEKEND